MSQPEPNHARAIESVRMVMAACRIFEDAVKRAAWISLLERSRSGCSDAEIKRINEQIEKLRRECGGVSCDE